MTRKPDDIEALEEAVATTHAAFILAKRRLHEARVAAAGVKPGDVVTSQRYGLVRVTEVNPMGGKVWVRGNPMRKNGGFGTAVRNLFDEWELALDVTEIGANG